MSALSKNDLLREYIISIPKLPFTVACNSNGRDWVPTSELQEEKQQQSPQTRHCICFLGSKNKAQFLAAKEPVSNEGDAKTIQYDRILQRMLHCHSLGTFSGGHRKNITEEVLLRIYC